MVMGSAALVRVLDSAEAVVLTNPNVSGVGAALAEAVFGTVAEQARRELDGHPEDSGDRTSDLPAVAFLDDAVGRALKVSGPTADVAAAGRDVAPHLNWERRRSNDDDPAGFLDGHANAILIGPRGLMRSDDVTLGVTLMAPHVQYPDHQHPPDEFYVVLSPGQWRQGGGPWHEPGPGGVVVHAPHVVHSMRSGDTPLLALWFLRTH